VSWTNILVPLTGGDQDALDLAVAKALAAPFGATVTAAYSSMVPTMLFSWVTDAGVGVTDLGVREFNRVASAGEARARNLLARLDYPHKALEDITADDWAGLRSASRFADVVVWNPSPARGHGVFASAFQQILMDERRPVLLADRPPAAGGLVAIAWDGGREASGAARRALPWLQKAEEVVVLTAPQAMARPCEPGRILRYLADNSVPAEPMVLHSNAEAGPLLVDAARRLGATMLVAGAFGHPRLQRFIFGGTTQLLLESLPAPALFLSH
jgi:nucleotide-binding universal stress UspA family protein